METIKNKTFAEVKELLKDNFIVKDDKTLKSLYLITYKRKVDSESDVEVEKPSMDKQYDIFQRGIILEKETNKPIFVSFRDREEFDETKSELSNYGLDWSSCQIEESVEGTQIKLFYYQGEWRVATSHCIDAHRANWNGNNFYELFLEAAECEKFNFKSMDPKYCHLLVMQHPKNVLVTEFKVPKLIHILSRDMSQNDMPEVKLDIGLSKPAIVLNFKSMEELLKDVNENKTIDKEGYIVRDLKSEKRIKIMSKVYKEASELRMNNTSNNIAYHYLQLKAQNKVEDYLKYYEKNRPIFEAIEMKLEDMISEIYQQYLRKYKFKVLKMNDVPYQFRPIIYELHGKYLATHKGITRRNVSELLYNKAPEQIAYMYNMYYDGVRKILSSGDKISNDETKE